jgi:RNA polymerase sigma-70 factor (ECF subfamily)
MNPDESSAPLSLPLSLGDRAALGQLFEEHGPKLQAMLQRRLDPKLRVRMEAEDILNNAYILAQHKWKAFQAQRTMAPYPWLYRLVLDCLIEEWRRQTRKGRDVRRELPFPEESSAQLVMGLVGAGTSPSAGVARADLRDQMGQTLAMLKPADRDLLWMRHFDQLAFADMAMVLEITENAATVRYVRALKRLKELWRQLHPREEDHAGN